MEETLYTLTELKATGAERFLALFDRSEPLRTTLSVVTEYGLYAGKKLDADALAALRDASTRSLCRQRALRIIGARAMSEKELRDRLTEKGESQANAEETVEWLVSLGFLDDADYAAMCVRHYAAKGYGIRRVKDELYRRGIPRELWDEALESLPEQDGCIDALLRRRLGGAAADRAACRKAADYLFRRGFSGDEIYAALDRYKNSTEEA